MDVADRNLLNKLLGRSSHEKIWPPGSLGWWIGRPVDKDPDEQFCMPENMTQRCYETDLDPCPPERVREMCAEFEGNLLLLIQKQLSDIIILPCITSFIILNSYNHPGQAHDFTCSYHFSSISWSFLPCQISWLGSGCSCSLATGQQHHRQGNVVPATRVGSSSGPGPQARAGMGPVGGARGSPRGPVEPASPRSPRSPVRSSTVQYFVVLCSTK